MANTQRMGFEGLAYYGVKGSTAATALTNSRDITQDIGKEEGDTTVRGAGSSPPMKTSKVTAITTGIQITLLYDSADTAVEAMKVAAAAGTPVAIRLKDYAAGKGFDGDCNVSYGHPYPLAGEQVITFDFTPTRDAGREPQPYV